MSSNVSRLGWVREGQQKASRVELNRTTEEGWMSFLLFRPPRPEPTSHLDPRMPPTTAGATLPITLVLA